MLSRKYFSLVKIVFSALFLLCFKSVSAHNPDISSLMIYEQNGKTILLIKSSLTAFEGEVDYIYGKDAYKTPEEFRQLVIKLFKEKCSIEINGETIQFNNTQIQLGHETNLFSELVNIPKDINSLHLKNALFKDMSNNLCETILNLNGIPLKQYILNKDNQQEATFKVEDHKWEIVKTSKPFYQNPIILLGLAALLIGAIIAFVRIKKKKTL
ncbi:hypothetical protein ADIARSV_0941 [Arcticibacter svalbardensis MN12-7]|uniref:Uncharacterized protein n=2 Tax=Arcticibacter TaxID=1288026 RepID=R9H3W0_9SPHI|nr:hypothetical protein ADIARSV_0941 [Arcticibacter svalbardensis MN12-7]